MIIQKNNYLYSLLNSIISIDSFISKDNKYLIWLSENRYNINWLNIELLLLNKNELNNQTNNQTNNLLNNQLNNKTNNLLNNQLNKNILNEYLNYKVNINNYDCNYLPDILVTYYCINIHDSHIALNEPISCYEYKNNFLHILTRESENVVYEFNLQKNILSNKYTINTHYDIIKFYVTNNKNIILAYCLDNTIQIFKVNDNNEISNINSIEIPGWIYYFSPVAFFNDTKLALYCGALCVYDLLNNVWIKKENIMPENRREYQIKKINISSDEKYIFLTYFNKHVEQYDTDNFKLVGKYFIDNTKYNALSTLLDMKINYKLQDEHIFNLIIDYKKYILDNSNIHPNKYKNLQNLSRDYVLVKSKLNTFIMNFNLDIISKESTIDISNECIELLDNNRLIKFVNFDSGLKFDNYKFFPEKIRNLFNYYLHQKNMITASELKKNESTTINNEHLKIIIDNLDTHLLEDIFDKIKISHYI